MTDFNVGDYVFGPDGYEWRVIAIGGKDKNVLHLKKPSYRVSRADDCRLSRSSATEDYAPTEGELC